MTQPATPPTPQQQNPAAPPPYPAPAGAAGTAPAPTAAAAARRKPPQQPESSVKETLESILVAFILAFIFRAFVVEAFVIPTGSMAPTLLGAHMRFHCDDCGYVFDTNYSPEQIAGGEDLYIPSRARRMRRNIYCPNCGYKIPSENPLDPANGSEQPDVHYGDRILVLKYLYLFEKPQRWDVVVFKSPDREPNYGPPTYTQNYIKRLIGRPGESILILDGDIYVGQGDEDVTKYQIQTKPRYVQQALWRVIYDNDFHPTGVPRVDGSTWKQPWSVRDGGGWNLGGNDQAGRVFRFDNKAGGSTLYFDPDANPTQHAFTDWLAYDYEVPPANNPAHDLKLAFVYDRSAGDGPLRAKLTSGDDQFVAEITPTDARLIHHSPKGDETIGSAKLPADGKPIRVELTNCDYQATLRINDTDVARTNPQQYHPNIPALLEAYRTNERTPAPTVDITAANQTAALSHVGLWRDVYYINRSPPGSGSQLVWAIPSDIPRSVMHLGKDEYFVLGDNSLISGDARYWNVPIDLPADQLQIQSGRVPGRFLLGRAFFVYWPAGYRPTPALPGLAPNFGDMRFIR